MAVQNSNDFRIYVGGSGIACLIDAELTINRETRETTCKNSNGVRTLESSVLTWSGSGTGYFDNAATYGYDDLFTAIKAGANVTVRWSSGKTGETYYEGPAIITNLGRSGGVNDNTQFNVSFEGNGDLTSGTEA